MGEKGRRTMLFVLKGEVVLENLDTEPCRLNVKSL